jgi:phosphate:Na+ symporter
MALPLLPWLPAGAAHIGLSGPSTVLALHLAVNGLAALIWLPLARLGARLSSWLMPRQEEAADHLSSPRYLSLAALDTPSVALANAALETGRMSEVLDRMMLTALKAMQAGSTETLKELRLQDARLNAYQTAIQSYLSDITDRNLSPEDTRHAMEMVLYVSNLEHAGDIIQLNLADRIKSKLREGHRFSVTEQKAIDELCSMIHSNMRLAAAVLGSRDVEGAQTLIVQKDAFRALEQRVIHDQVKARGAGKGEALRRSALFVDLIRDLHRINTHVVSAGYPIVDAAGLLRATRLRKNAR